MDFYKICIAVPSKEASCIQSIIWFQYGTDPGHTMMMSWESYGTIPYPYYGDCMDYYEIRSNPID